MKLKAFPVWMTVSMLAIAGVSLAWWDSSDIPHSTLALVAAVTGMAYTMLAGRGLIICYWFGFVNAPLYAYLSYRWGYYGDMALNVYYFVMMIPGLAYWRRNLKENTRGEIIKTQLSSRERSIWGALIVVSSVILFIFLKYIGGSRPLCDALTNVLSIAAIVLTVKRCIEQWVMWIIVDLIECLMWLHVGGASMAILAMWLLFLVDGIYLFALWVGDLRKA